MRWWRRASLRTRLTSLAVGGLAAGLAVGGLVMLAVLAMTMQRSVDSEANRTGTDVARLVQAGALPEPVPVTGEQVVQVVDGQSRVLAASLGADRLVPILRDDELAELRTGGNTMVDGDRLGVAGSVRVVAVAASSPAAGEVTVLVAKPMSDLRHSYAAVRGILLLAFPLLVAGLAMVMWRVVGAALRPVEGLRASAAEITAAGGPASLPVPASRDEVRRLAVTLNDMLDRLERARVRQRAFVADAAHELRSPLATLRTQLEVAQRLAQRDPAAADWSQLSDELLTDVERLSRLVDDLLLLARADETARHPGPVAPVELGQLLREVARGYPAGSVVVDTEGPPVWAAGEPEALRRVVSNLLDNAVRYAAQRVTLAVAPAGPYQLITVTDDGPGIPAADRERVFDRFTRLDDARDRDAGGAGLGLAIVRELVRRHGGSVRLVEADPAPGLRAEVRLPPLVDPPPADPHPADHERTGTTRPVSRLIGS
ncbi:HAMP domain-containing protein [Natronosporangium hydrolyticum]|uniref:histidine kinase n=1 Tax=Natronosporangium hydrolyticum TaxID=2811111 RepID=A0A895YM44_9ACTN|nr:ATP-binding protein [Natronosporangium hydrolyticum]QSB15756.1 HAMP domain-containing protein [Natronosporangium hydrolyticum]